MIKKYKVIREDGTFLIYLMRYKGAETYSFINMTKGHICPCVFNSIKEAEEDFKNYKNIIKVVEQEVVLGVDRMLIDSILVENPFGVFQEEGLSEFIEDNLRGMDRDIAEEDISFKQIIPYLVVKFENKYLLYKRTKKVSESRLREKLSIGIGGHINPIDDVQGSIIAEALRRQLSEEIKLKISQERRAVGFINDDQNEVGKVHLGVVFTVEADDLEFEVLEKENIVAEWATKEQLKTEFDRLESWSQLVLDIV